VGVSLLDFVHNIINIKEKENDMEFGFGTMIEKLKKDPKTIVFTEGSDPRILEAASRLLASSFLHPILLGNLDEIEKAAEEAGYNIRGARIIDPENYERFDEMVDLFCELRKSKGVTPEQARKTLSASNYFGTMLVKMGEADALLGGATYSTADTVRPALQLIKTKPGNNIVSSCFILVRPSATGENEVLAMSDCAINIKPTEDDLVEIAGETAECARVFGVDPKVAFLSYSTLGSGKGEDVDKVRNAAAKAKERYPELPIEGELQFDAAVAPRVARTKCPGSEVAGHANTFIFPDINAGNIGYKIAQRLGNFDAYGPILLGLNASINDLSRGCNALEVYSMAIITAALA
jgi:phosphate acetyltransferase